jgi:hypothetical protein
MRYNYLVVWYLSPSRGRILWKIEHESLCFDCVLVFIVTFKCITTVDWLTDILWRVIWHSNMTAYISSTSICRYISTFSTCALKVSIGNN